MQSGGALCWVGWGLPAGQTLMALLDTELAVCKGATQWLKQCIFILHHVSQLVMGSLVPPGIDEYLYLVILRVSGSHFPECRFPIPILSQKKTNKTKQNIKLCIQDVISSKLVPSSEVLPVCLTPQWYQMIAFSDFLWQKFYTSQVPWEHCIPSQNLEYFMFLLAFIFSWHHSLLISFCSPWRHHYVKLCSTWASLWPRAMAATGSSPPTGSPLLRLHPGYPVPLFLL